MSYQKDERDVEFNAAKRHHEKRLKKTIDLICTIHDEIEPNNHDELLWSCPQCSKESIKKIDLDKVMRKLAAKGLV